MSGDSLSEIIRAAVGHLADFRGSAAIRGSAAAHPAPSADRHEAACRPSSPGTRAQVSLDSTDPQAVRQAAMPAPLAGAGLPLALIERGGRLTASNDSFCELMGCPGDELMGRDIRDLFPQADRDRREVIDHIAAVAARRERRATFETVLDDGRALSLTFTPAGQVAGLAQALLLVDDVTESRRVAEEQQRLRDLLGKAASEWRATFDAIDVPIVILDAGNRAERLNRSARALAGRDFAELLGRRLGDFGDDLLWREADALAEWVRAEATAAEHEVRDASSGRTWAIAASLGIPDLSEARPVILTVRELTSIVQLQESLRHSQTMAAIGSLVAGVAHEVRNPLFGISSVIDALELRLEGREEVSTHLGFLRRDLGRLEKLMAELLDFGRPVVPATEPTPLVEVVEEAISACSPQLERAGVEVARRGGDTPPVLLDRRRVCQAVINVVENAVHHAPPGSRIAVSLETIERRGRQLAQVTVRDHGPGFRENDLARVFEPFFSRREGGTGLGMPIVRQIVEGHGGEVEAANALDGGAVVRLRFPLVATTPTARTVG